MDEKARETRMRYHGKNETGGYRPNKKRRRSRLHTSLPRMGKGGPRQRRSGTFVSSANAPLFSLYYPAVFHTMSALSGPYGAPSPRGEGCDTRMPSSKKGGEAALVNLSAPQVPSSRAKPRDLYCTAAICTQAPSLKRHLGASFFACPSPTFYRSARKIPPLRSG